MKKKTTAKGIAAAAATAAAAVVVKDSVSFRKFINGNKAPGESIFLGNCRESMKEVLLTTSARKTWHKGFGSKSLSDQSRDEQTHIQAYNPRTAASAAAAAAAVCARGAVPQPTPPLLLLLLLLLLLTAGCYIIAASSDVPTLPDLSSRSTARAMLYECAADNIYERIGTVCAFPQPVCNYYCCCCCLLLLLLTLLSKRSMERRCRTALRHGRQNNIDPATSQFVMRSLPLCVHRPKGFAAAAVLPRSLYTHIYTHSALSRSLLYSRPIHLVVSCILYDINADLFSYCAGPCLDSSSLLRPPISPYHFSTPHVRTCTC
ncbi:unnamed protein product, partial [Trichogramma brassicae]